MGLVGSGVGWADGVWADFNEIDPALLTSRDMLDDTTETELAGCGGQTRLFVCQLSDRLAEKGTLTGPVPCSATRPRGT